MQEAVIGDRYTASFLAAEPVALAAALDSLSDVEIVSNPALLVGSRSFDENFLRSSKIGRRGDVRVYGEVAPDTSDSLQYTKLVSSIFPGEQATVDGFRGFMTGKTILAALDKGSSSGSLVKNLRVLNLLKSDVPLGPQDGLVSGGARRPAAGSWRFLLFKGSFIPGGLIPGRAPTRAGTSPRVAPGVVWPPATSDCAGRSSRSTARHRSAPRCRRNRRPKKSAAGASPSRASARFDHLVQPAEQVVGLLLREAGHLDPPGERGEVQHRGADQLSVGQDGQPLP